MCRNFKAAVHICGCAQLRAPIFVVLWDFHQEGNFLATAQTSSTAQLWRILKFILFVCFLLHKMLNQRLGFLEDQILPKPFSNTYTHPVEMSRYGCRDGDGGWVKVGMICAHPSLFLCRSWSLSSGPDLRTTMIKEI